MSVETKWCALELSAKSHQSKPSIKGCRWMGGHRKMRGPHWPALCKPPPTPVQGQTETIEYPSAFSGEGW